MKSSFVSDLVTKNYLGGKYVELVDPFIYFSERFNKFLIVPVGFVCDFESVPLLRGSSKRAGVIHDYLCRIDSVPVVTKQMAATIYGEAQKCKDDMMGGGFIRAIKRGLKTTATRVAFGFHHKHKVGDTIDDFTR